MGCYVSRESQPAAKAPVQVSADSSAVSDDEMLRAIAAKRRVGNDAQREAYLAYLRHGDAGSTPANGVLCKPAAAAPTPPAPMSDDEWHSRAWAAYSRPPSARPPRDTTRS